MASGIRLPSGGRFRAIMLVELVHHLCEKAREVGIPLCHLE